MGFCVIVDDVRRKLNVLETWFSVALNCNMVKFYIVVPFLRMDLVQRN